MQELTQASHEYEKLREENSKIQKVENFINLGLVSTSSILTGLIYHNSIKDIPLHSPTEEEIIDALTNGIRYGFASASGTSGSITKYFETREEAIKALIQREKDTRLAGYFASTVTPATLMTYLLLLGINPGEKISKCSYALIKVFLNKGRELKSYLEAMRESRQKRKRSI